MTTGAPTSFPTRSLPPVSLECCPAQIITSFVAAPSSYLCAVQSLLGLSHAGLTYTCGCRYPASHVTTMIFVLISFRMQVLAELIISNESRIIESDSVSFYNRMRSFKFTATIRYQVGRMSLHLVQTSAAIVGHLLRQLYSPLQR